MASQVKPFSPSDAKVARDESIPDFVIEAVNELLAANYSSSIRLTQDEIINRIAKKSNADANSKVFRAAVFKWLDFESIYESAGWHVEYDRPSIGDDYEAYFRFTPK